MFCVCFLLFIPILTALVLPPAVKTSLQYLEEYDRSFIVRMSEGRKAGLAPHTVEFQRAQSLKREGIMREREELRSHISVVTKASTGIVLGVMADSGLRGVEALRAWTNGLSLKRNLLYAMDEISNVELPVSALDNLPVYVKYSTLKGGDAYMKEYRGEFSGVIFQPFLADEEFRQYGNFPLSVF